MIPHLQVTRSVVKSQVPATGVPAAGSQPGRIRLLLGCLLLGCLLCLAVPSTVAAGDWPQILGPQRNGVAASDEKLLDSWPDDGPRELWQHAVGDGFAGVAVAGNTAIVFHRTGNTEVAEAHAADTGKALWQHSSPTAYSSGFSPDQGPRCTPLIHGDAVLLFGAEGRLTCLDLVSGKERWHRETHRDFRAPSGYFGAGSTPVVAGELVLVNVGGGRSGAGVVAFDLKTGNTKWQATSEMASYSSPVIAELGGRRQAVFITRMKTLGLDPASGRVLWEFPFGKRGPTVNAASPQIIDGHVFVTAHYGVGAAFAKAGADSIDVVWTSDSLMSSQYTTSVPSGSVLIGIAGQERVDTPVLKCFDPRTRKVYWSEEDFGFGSLLRAGNRILALLTDGTLVQFKSTAKGYEELARASVLDTTTRALPALSRGRLYVRDTRTLRCLEVGQVSSDN